MTLKQRKRKSRYVLNNSVAAGETTPEALCLSCLMCNEPLEAHHRCYRKGFELDVEWKCKRCHVEADMKMRKETEAAVDLCLRGVKPGPPDLPFRWEEN